MIIKDLIENDNLISVSDPAVLAHEAAPAVYGMEEIQNTLLFIPAKKDIAPHLSDLTETGPCAIVMEEKTKINTGSIPVITVKNIRRAIAEAYAIHYEIDFGKLKFIGITGTNGKTTTATILYRILLSVGYKAGFIGTGRILIGEENITPKNYSMTTPDPSFLYNIIKRMQNGGCQYIVMEVSSHSIALEKISPIPFSCGIFTNLSREHLDFHKSIEEYFRTKESFLSSCKFGLYNIDDSYSKKAYERGKTKKSVGIIQRADVYATNIEDSGLDGISYIYHDNELLFRVKLQLPGAYNVYNSMLAITAAIHLGIKPCEAKRAVNSISTIDGRMEIIRDKITVIIDYAHTPDGLSNTLKTLYKAKKPRQSLICVFGCGGDRDKLKRPAMGKIAEEYSDKIFITSDNNRTEIFEDIASDILDGIECSGKVSVISDREDAITSAILSARRGDLVAIIGKGHEKYMIDKTGYHPFDERDIVSSALAKLHSHES